MELDRFSYRCGVIDCFNEMVRAGLKPMALAHPCPTPAERDQYLPFCREICGQYGLEPLELPNGVQPEDAAKFVRDSHADGVLCYSANNAAELVNLLSVMEIRVPEQVKIATFGQPAIHLDRIAYTETNPELVGNSAAELLLNRIEKGTSGHCVFNAEFHRPQS